ncbi:MAG: iron ABC transporter permease, partial [Muribaculaceae bacterium]|nr:iron ABC transporter permease [Muribaculaceae bacterium]
SGASLGVALVTLLFSGTLSVGALSWSGNAALVAGAAAGSFLTMGLLILLSVRLRNDLMLLIAGILLGYLTSSVVTLLSSLSTAAGVQSFVVWGMGTFGGVSLDTLPLFSILTIAGLIFSVTLAKPLNILLLGDNYARNLGVELGKVRNMLLGVTGLLTAIITAYCGPIGFIGLAMPHISRLLFRTDNHWVLLPATMLTGAIVALACNLASVSAANVIPINALTPAIGVPVILYVILRRH